MRLGELVRQAEQLGEALVLDKMDIVFIDPKGNVWEPDGDLALNIEVRAMSLRIKRRK